jgi:endonuclease/exonuclease/phosphatase family metal-dependent hydrolase
VVRNLPGVRIDHCLLSSELTATRAQVGHNHGSDHLGIFADVGWR